MTSGREKGHQWRGYELGIVCKPWLTRVASGEREQQWSLQYTQSLHTINGLVGVGWVGNKLCGRNHNFVTLFVAYIHILFWAWLNCLSTGGSIALASAVQLIVIMLMRNMVYSITQPRSIISGIINFYYNRSLGYVRDAKLSIHETTTGIKLHNSSKHCLFE